MLTACILMNIHVFGCPLVNPMSYWRTVRWRGLVTGFFLTFSCFNFLCRTQKLICMIAKRCWRQSSQSLCNSISVYCVLDKLYWVHGLCAELAVSSLTICSCGTHWRLNKTRGQRSMKEPSFERYWYIHVPIYKYKCIYIRTCLPCIVYTAGHHNHLFASILY